jgi:hypothetical protein
MKNPIAIAFFLAIFCISQLAISQDLDNNYRHRTWIMGVPQHLFQNGIKIEIDKNLSSPQDWIIFSPTIYYRATRENWFFGDNDLLGVKGAGLDIMYRWYFSELKEMSNFYLSAGGGYRLVQLEYEGNSWEGFVENGLDYYQFDESPWKKDIQTFNLKTIAGYKLIIDRHLAIDFYMGLGMKLSTEKLPENVQVFDDDNVYSFGGTGFIFVGGMRIGVGW